MESNGELVDKKEEERFVGAASKAIKIYVKHANLHFKYSNWCSKVVAYISCEFDNRIREKYVFNKELQWLLDNIPYNLSEVLEVPGDLGATKYELVLFLYYACKALRIIKHSSNCTRC